MGIGGAFRRKQRVALRWALSLGVVLSLFAWAATPAAAGAGVHLSGGGTATISQVAFNVTIEGGGAASGSFNCLMAGRSAFVLGTFGLKHLMKVEAHPTAASLDSTGTTVSFSGPGFLIMDGDTKQAVDIQVWANANTQQFQLTVVGVGAMPVEHMLTGHFQLS
jgi:hypothetical protein